MIQPVRHKWGASLPVLFLIFWGCSGPEQAGIAEAERDIAAGTLRLKYHGLLPHWHDTYCDLMRQRLGVSMQAVAGCDDNADLRQQVQAYNDRMEREISTRFGPSAHQSIIAEAQKHSESAQP
jgi:hypothetical protein